MRASFEFGLTTLAALAAGALLYATMKPGSPRPQVDAPDVRPEALYAQTFHDAQGHELRLAAFRGRPLVLNFWATWCAPCRREMPALNREAARLAGRVQFVGLADDDPRKVEAFAHELGVGYPLAVGGDEITGLAVRLGNHDRVLPYTVILNGDGSVQSQKVGIYTETELDAALAPFLR